MKAETVERKLLAILAADVVGYSRLMESDEVGTLATLTERRSENIEPTVTQHHGRVVKLMGDGLLIEFASVVDAMRCAVEVQKSMAECNSMLPEDQQIVLRIGVNLGDVIVENEDIYGDGVNIAARLQNLAEPGGVCISRTVFNHVKGKIQLSFEYVGEQQVKNMSEPVQTYRVKLAETGRGGPSVAPQLTEISEKPSIAVLPFENMSSDPEQEYFSDGITEDIITGLSRFKSLFVIARNSSFVFRQKAVDVAEVRRRLGVRYIVEGSVRKAGNRVRVSAQLIDATTGNHIWAERYDRVLEDIFAVQDEVTQSIVATLPGRLESAGAEQASRKPTDNMVAYDYILRGEQQLNLFNTEGNDKAIAMFETAVELDPRCARAYAGLGFAYQLKMWVFGDFGEDLADRAYENAQMALSLDSNDSQAHAILCDLYMNRGEHERAGSHIQKAITLNPNDSFAAWEMVFYLAYTGRPEEAIDWAKKAIHLNPYHPDWYLEFLGDAYYMACRYDEAIETFESWDGRPYWISLELAAFCAQVGRMDAARDALEAYQRARPVESTLEEFIATHKRVCKRPTDWAHWHDGYRKAGLQTSV